MKTAAGFVEIDGRRFDFESAVMELRHWESGDADWTLELRRAGEGQGDPWWLGGTASPSPRRIEDFSASELTIENRDLDALFGALLGTHITIYPGGELVCRATFRATPEGAGAEGAGAEVAGAEGAGAEGAGAEGTGAEGAGAEGTGVRLVSAFEFEWDRSLDPPGVTVPEPRTARLELLATVRGLEPG